MKDVTIKDVGIVGAGVMGPGIAEVFAASSPSAGFSVVVYDPVGGALDKARERLDEDFTRFHLEGLLDKNVAAQTRNRIRLVAEPDQLQKAQLVIEAVPERIEIKKKVFRELDELLPAASILATNSSGLCVSDIAAGTKRPQLCIGTHFLNPPFLMPLVEVVKGRETADTTVSLVMDLLTALGKHPVLVRRDVPGYVCSSPFWNLTL
jgi:3-hydroxyacyl-CoA dehydrogenase